MGAKSIGKPLWIKGRAPSIASRSLGARFELIAGLICRARGDTILNKNRWLKFGEIDLFTQDVKGRFCLIEVRGRRDGRYRSVEMMTFAKRQRLRRLAEYESRRLKAPVRVEFLEIVGDPLSKGFWPRYWWARLFRTKGGFYFRWYELD